MNTRCSLCARAAAFVLLIAALFAIPTVGRAQAVDCATCDHFTFAVNAGLNCGVTICYSHSPAGPVLCASVSPGKSLVLTCPIYQAWVNTCSGPFYLVPSATDSRCSRLLKFEAGCCGNICNVPSIDVCPRIEVQPAPCATIGCP